LKESLADWRSMTRDRRLWRLSFSSSLPGKAARSGVLQEAGDMLLLLCFRDGVRWSTRGTGVEEALIVAAEKPQAQKVLALETDLFSQIR